MLTLSTSTLLLFTASINTCEPSHLNEFASLTYDLPHVQMPCTQFSSQTALFIAGLNDLIGLGLSEDRSERWNQRGAAYRVCHHSQMEAVRIVTYATDA